MSEEAQATVPTSPESEGDTQESAWKPPASQADLDHIIGERLARERAKFADYEDLKARAAKWDEAEEAAKSETQKAVERAERAEAEITALQQQASRLQVIAEFGIPEDMQALLTASTREELEAQAELIQKNLRQKQPMSGVLGKPEPSAPMGGSFDELMRGRLR